MRVRISRSILAALFILAGIAHFARPAMYRQIVPPGFGSPAALVIVSGIFEILGGAGLLIPPLRRSAAWGLIALLICVLPANVYMAMHPDQFHLPGWLLWARLPLQPVLIAWVWSAALRWPTVER